MGTLAGRAPDTPATAGRPDMLVMLPSVMLAAAAATPCTPLAALSTDVGVLSPPFSPSNCGHSYQIDLFSAPSPDLHLSLTATAANASVQLLISGPQGTGGWNGIPGVATGTPQSAVGGVPFVIPVQLVQNVTEVILRATVVGSAEVTTFSVQIRAPQFRFAGTMGDHMVLQRGPARANVLGFGVPGRAVSVSVARAGAGGGGEPQELAPVHGVVRSDGSWSVALPPVSSVSGTSVAYTVTATSGDATIALADVLFGDVCECLYSTIWLFAASTDPFLLPGHLRTRTHRGVLGPEQHDARGPAHVLWCKCHPRRAHAPEASPPLLRRPADEPDAIEGAASGAATVEPANLSQRGWWQLQCLLGCLLLLWRRALGIPWGSSRTDCGRLGRDLGGGMVFTTRTRCVQVRPPPPQHHDSLSLI